MAAKGVGKRLEIAEEDRRELERIVRAASSEVRMVERAPIVLAAGEGLTTAQIAQAVACSERTVKRWRRGMRVAGLRDCAMRLAPGRPLSHGPEVRARLIAKACTRPGAHRGGRPAGALDLPRAG